MLFKAPLFMPLARSCGRHTRRRQGRLLRSGLALVGSCDRCELEVRRRKEEPSRLGVGVCLGAGRLSLIEEVMVVFLVGAYHLLQSGSVEEAFHLLRIDFVELQEMDRSFDQSSIVEHFEQVGIVAVVLD